MNLEVRSQDNHIAFAGPLNHQSVVHAWPERHAVFKQHQHVIIDFSEVNKLDTAGLAWVLQLIGEAKQRAVTLAFTHVPPSLIKLAKISNLEPVLPLQ